MIDCTLYSNCIGDSVTLGGLMILFGALMIPVTGKSSSQDSMDIAVTASGLAILFDSLTPISLGKRYYMGPCSQRIYWWLYC